MFQKSVKGAKKNWKRGKFRKNSSIARIARKEAQKVVKGFTETKSYIGSFNQAPTDDVPSVANLIYPMSQGTDAEKLIGEKFYLKNIHLKMQLYTNLSSNDFTKCARVIVFRTKEALTNTTLSLSTSPQIQKLFRNVPSNIPLRGHIDLHKVTLLYDRTFTLTPNIVDQVLQKPLDVKIKFDKQECFDADNSGYLKNSNIYLCVVGYDGNVTLNSVGFNTSYTINYKDS